MRGQSTSSERRQNIQRKQDSIAGTTAQLNRPDQSPEQLYFEVSLYELCVSAMEKKWCNNSNQDVSTVKTG